MNIYIADGISQRTRARMLAGRLKSMGHEVTSSWIWRNETYEDIQDQPAVKKGIAETNVRDINRANIVVVFLDKPSTHGGKHFELGYAYGTGTALVVVGPPPSLGVFSFLPNIRRLDCQTDFLEWLELGG